MAVQHSAEDRGTVRAHGHEEAQPPGDDLGDEAHRLEAIDHAVGEADELDAELAHDLHAAKLEPVGEFEDGPAVEHGGPGIGRRQSRRVRLDRLRNPGRRDETADDARAVVGLEPIDPAALIGQAPPDRQQEAGDDVERAGRELGDACDLFLPGGGEGVAVGFPPMRLRHGGDRDR